MMETSDGRTDMDGRTHTLRDHDQLATFAPEILWGISQEETEMKCSESTRRPWKLFVTTVNTAYSAIGYSAKSDIVPILVWSHFSYTDNYRI